MHRLIALALLLGISGCSIAPFQKDKPADAASSRDPAAHRTGEGPVLKTPTDEIFKPGAEPVIEAPPPVVELPRERPSRPPATLAPASRALVAQAAAQRKKGDLPGASVSLDRALRIEPNNPLLWIETGRLRMDQRNFAQAENMARKALAMSVGDDATQSAAWDLVGQSLKARGRNVEAEEAFAKAREVAPR